MEGDFVLEKRMMLKGIFRDGKADVSLNDIVVSRKGGAAGDGEFSGPGVPGENGHDVKYDGTAAGADEGGCGGIAQDPGESREGYEGVKSCRRRTGKERRPLKKNCMRGKKRTQPLR